jgi:hypothetical protein
MAKIGTSFKFCFSLIEKKISKNPHGDVSSLADNIVQHIFTTLRQEMGFNIIKENVGFEHDTVDQVGYFPSSIILLTLCCIVTFLHDLSYSYISFLCCSHFMKSPNRRHSKKSIL